MWHSRILQGLLARKDCFHALEVCFCLLYAWLGVDDLFTAASDQVVQVFKLVSLSDFGSIGENTCVLHSEGFLFFIDNHLFCIIAI